MKTIKAQTIEKVNKRDTVVFFILRTELRCHNVYWAGTHQRNALEFMRKHILRHLP